MKGKTPYRIKRKLGIMLKRERIKKNKTQKDIADILNTDKQYISNVENGLRNITLEQLQEIINAIGCTNNDILNFIETNDQ